MSVSCPGTSSTAIVAVLSQGRPRNSRRAIAYAVIEPNRSTESVIVVATKVLLTNARPNGALAHMSRELSSVVSFGTIANDPTSATGLKVLDAIQMNG